MTYTQGFLTGVENFASLSYQLGGGMVHEINHSNGVKWTQTINTGDRQARPSTLGTSGVAGGNNWSTGTYDYDGASNIHQIGNAQFRYDRLHRLVEGQVDFGGIKTQTATYDSYGNLTSLTTNGAVQSLSPSSTTNRLTGGVTAYDAAGNNTKLSLGGITYEFGFDASGQMEFLKSNANQAKVFFYDAADERLLTWDCPGNSCGGSGAYERWTLRGLGAEVLRVFEGKSSDTLAWKEDFVYRGGKTLAAVRPKATGGEETFAIHLDHLGSTRQVTNSVGVEVERHHYYPFGEEATTSQATDIALKFTGHERDRNGGGKGMLDYMHARSCSPVTGRFLSVDPVLAANQAVRMPQSWNRYAAVANNPVKHVDPFGKIFQIAACNGDHENDVCKAAFSLLQEALGSSASSIRLNPDGTIDLMRGVSKAEFASKSDLNRGLLALILHKDTFTYEFDPHQTPPTPEGGHIAGKFFSKSRTLIVYGSVRGVTGNAPLSRAGVLVHEIGHAVASLFPDFARSFSERHGRDSPTKRGEAYAVNFENRYRASVDLPILWGYVDASKTVHNAVNESLFPEGFKP